LMNNKI